MQVADLPVDHPGEPAGVALTRLHGRLGDGGNGLVHVSPRDEGPGEVGLIERPVAGVSSVDRRQRVPGGALGHREVAEVLTDTTGVVGKISGTPEAQPFRVVVVAGLGLGLRTLGRGLSRGGGIADAGETEGFPCREQ